MGTRIITVLFALSGTALPAAAQATDPADDPALTDPSVGARARELDRQRPAAPGMAPTEAPAADPVTPGAVPETAIPGLETSDFSVSRAPLRREGAFLVRQRGSMVRLRTGDWAFVFHPDAQGRAERPMILVPSQNLARMEHLAADRADKVAFLLTGQVFVYLGRNYILPTLPPVLMMADEAAASSGPAPGASEAGGPARPADGEPTVAQLIRELEAQRETPRSIGQARAPAPAGNGAAGRAPEPLPEGSVITRRRGRLVRLAGGETAFLMDADADADPAADPPLTLVPCLNRERMENHAANAGEGMAFEVSGRVLTWQGRNYLVPTMYQAYPEGTLTRRQ